MSLAEAAIAWLIVTAAFVKVILLYHAAAGIDWLLGNPVYLAGFLILSPILAVLSLMILSALIFVVAYPVLKVFFFAERNRMSERAEVKKAKRQAKLITIAHEVKARRLSGR